MKDIVIYGIGGTSRQILEALEAMNIDAPRWNILGFVDDDATLTGTPLLDYPILGTGAVLATPIHTHTHIAIGIANDRDLTIRKSIRHRLASPDSRFPVIAHPNVVTSKRSRIGAGTVLLDGSSVQSLAEVGRHVVVLPNSVISHDTVVEDYVSIATGVVLGGYGRVGSCSFLGSGALTRPHIRIGQRCRVGMGAAVIHDVDDGATVAGVPARPLQNRQ